VLWEGFELAEHCPQSRGAGLRALQAEGYADALEEAAQQAETALRFELIQKVFQERATGQ
jgi:hypothetical protein